MILESINRPEGCSKNENSNKSSWKKCTFSGRVFKSALKSRIVHQKKLRNGGAVFIPHLFPVVYKCFDFLLTTNDCALLPGKFSFLEQPPGRSALFPGRSALFRVVSSRKSALLPGRFIRAFVFGTAFCCRGPMPS